ncbi:MAG: leucine-rich repeat protein [Eubacterium sp.]|nr:leucine-rich repeat protein [Eubacterium sp.]
MKKKFLSIVLSALIAITNLTIIPVSSYAYDEAQETLSNISTADWMSVIRDDTRLTEITIPGTHDSCARKFHNEDAFGVMSGISKCQSLTIREQLDAGIRFLDVRCEVDASSHSVKTVHGSTDCWNGNDYYYLDYVFNDVYSFLDAHPSETVLISIKEDDGNNGVPHFTNAVYEYIHGYRSNDNLYFYGEGYNYKDRWYLGKSVPKLSDVRGKCVLFNRFDQYIGSESGQGVTVDENESGQKIKYNEMEGDFAEPYYQNIYSNNTGIGTAHIQDFYKWNTGQKITATQYMLSLGHWHGEYYINYSSTVSDSSIPNPQDLSKKVNPSYFSYTYEKTKPSGIFAMDFATSDIARKIIENNEGVCTVVEGWDGNVYYRLNRKTGELRISGTGAMNNYAFSNAKGQNGAGSTAPWGDQNKNAVDDNQYNSDLITSVVIEEGITSIGNYAFYGYDHLTSVSIPSSVKSIGEGAFTKCSALTSIDISNKYITSIGNYAFKDCTGLTSFTTSANVTSIGTDAFANCGSLVMRGDAGIYSQSYANDNSITYVSAGEYNSDINWFISKATYYEPYTSDLGGTGVTNYADGENTVRWEASRADDYASERSGVTFIPWSIDRTGINYINTSKSALGGESSDNGVTISFYRLITGNYYDGCALTLAQSQSKYLAIYDNAKLYYQNGSSSQSYTTAGSGVINKKWQYITVSIDSDNIRVYIDGVRQYQTANTSNILDFLESESTLVYPGSYMSRGTCSLALDEISVLPVAVNDVEANAMFMTYKAPIIYESDQRPGDADVKIYSSNGYENVIYTHGENTTTNSGVSQAADYMFKGDEIADGDNDDAYIYSTTAAGTENELYTTFSVNSKYTASEYVLDNYYNILRATEISNSNGRRTYRLSGNLTSGYADGSDDDIRLRIALTTDGENYIAEYKYVHVTQHPVSSHALSAVHRSWDNKTRDVGVFFRANGSTGYSSTYYSGNYAYVHTPVFIGNGWGFASNYNADNFFMLGDGKTGNDSDGAFPSTTNLDIVNAGAYGQRENGSGTVTTSGTTANYYIDKSQLKAGETMGGVSLDNDSNTFRVSGIVTRLAARHVGTNYWWRNCYVTTDNGLWWNLTSDNSVAESIETRSNNDNGNPEEFNYAGAQLTGYLDKGNEQSAFVSVGINHSSDEYCAVSQINFNFHICDKSTLRNLVDGYDAEGITGAWTSHDDWEAYQKALSDAYAVLNDYKDMTSPDANSTVYKNLVAAHDAIAYTDTSTYEAARNYVVGALSQNKLYERNSLERVFDFMHTELKNQQSYDIHAGKIYFNMHFVEELDIKSGISDVKAAAVSKTDEVKYDLDEIESIKDEFLSNVSISETVGTTKYTYYCYYSQDSYDSLVEKTISDINNAYMHYSVNTNSGNVVKEAANPFSGKDLSGGFTISFSKYCAYDSGWNTSLINFSTGKQSDNRYFIIMANGVVLFNDGNGGVGGNNGCYFDVTDNSKTNSTGAAWHDIDLVFYKENNGNHMMAYYVDNALAQRFNLSNLAAGGYPNGVSSGNDGIFSFLSSSDIKLYYGASFTAYGTMGGTCECYLDKVDYYTSPIFPIEKSVSNDLLYSNDFTDSLGGEAVTGNADGSSVHLDTSNNDGRTNTAYLPWSRGASTNYISTNASPFENKNTSNGYSISFYQRINGNYWDNTESITFAQGATGECKYFTIGTDGWIRFNNGNGGSDSSLSSAGLYFDYTTNCNSIAKQTWQLITVDIIDDYHFRYYVNGTLAANIEVTGTSQYAASGGLMSFLANGNTKLYLGSYTPYWQTATLSLDNVKCFSHSLSDSEVAALYKSETNNVSSPIYSNSFDEDIPDVVSGAAKWEASYENRSGLLHIMSDSADGDVDIYVDGVLSSDTSSIKYGSEITAVYSGTSTPYGWDNSITNSRGTTADSFDGEEYTFTLTGNSTLKYFATDEIVDLSKLLAAYEGANDILMNLNGKTAKYSNSSLTELTSSINSDVRDYLSADARTLARFPMSVETKADAYANAINEAVDSLEEAETGVDLSVYQKLVDTVEKADDDIYSLDNEFKERMKRIASDINGNSVEYESIDGDSVSIKTVKASATQGDIDDINTSIASGLSTKIKQYEIKLKEGTLSAADGITFNNSTSSYDRENDKYLATYSSKLNLRADEDTAWYMDFDSSTTSRSNQYQGFGKRFSTTVFGNINIYAHQRTNDNPYKLTIKRTYNNLSNEPIQLVDYVSSSYVLPPAPAIANYSFNGYKVGSETKQPGASITLDSDKEITAEYTFNGEANCAISATALENGTGYSNSVAYNTRIELKGGDNAYGWVELIKDGKETNWRPFYIGANLVYYATESTTLKAVTKAEFDGYAFTLPTINNKQSNALVAEGKTIFNGQIVYTDADDIVEYGILVASSDNPEYELSQRDVILENSGVNTDFTVRRCKSTKLVGAKQFTISVRNLSGEIAYRGYIIHNTSNGLITEYTDISVQTI